jgi:hypothetical protein
MPPKSGDGSKVALLLDWDGHTQSLDISKAAKEALVRRRIMMMGRMASISGF